jgi:hypothetical protein
LMQGVPHLFLLVTLPLYFMEVRCIIKAEQHACQHPTGVQISTG